MKLEYYSPTFRNVLLQEVKLTKTAGGIYIPSTEFLNESAPVKEYEVIKVGDDCLKVRPGDKVILTKGIFLDKLEFRDDTGRLTCYTSLNDGGIFELYQVMEQQIIGIERIPKEPSMDDFTVETPSLDNLPEPEFKAEVVTGMKAEDYEYQPIESNDSIRDAHSSKPTFTRSS